MEAIILAQPAPTQKAAGKQDLQSSSESGSKEFAPLLDAEVKRTQKNNETNNATNPVENVEGVETTETAETVEANDNTATIEASLSSVKESTTNLAFSPFQKAVSVETLPAAGQAVPQSETAATKTGTETASSLQSQQLAQTESSQISGLTNAINVKTAQTSAQSTPETNTTATETPKSTETAAASNSGTTHLTQPSRAETLLLEQIQQLLSKNQNNGPIIIKNNAQSKADAPGNGSSTLFAGSSNEVQIQQQVVAGMTSAGNTAPQTNKTTTLDSIRQDTVGQYFKAKIGDSVGQNDNQFQQASSEQQSGNGQSKESAQSTLSSSLSTLGGTSTTESTTTTSQFSMITPTTTSSQPAIEGKLAPGTHAPIQEHEIGKNLIQHFNVNPRLKTSNLSIQLNPAELGQIKLNIIVKDDSITANIIAQSQQIVETIEKHMPKLRAVLESQGFTIDDFEVTLDSDTDSQQELFQEQFASQQQNSSQSANTTSSASESFEEELDSAAIAELSADSNAEDTGVNVTV